MYGIEGQPLKLFRNYLHDRNMLVKKGHQTCKNYTIKNGVPQGSILGPMLFTLYVNDLPTCVQNCEMTLYADDTTIYVGSKYPSNMQRWLNEDLERV